MDKSNGNSIVPFVETGIQAVICAALLLLITAALINIQYGLDSIAMLAVFSSDEPFAVQLLVNNVNNNTLDPQGFYNYGYGYHTLAFYLIKCFESFNYTVDERLIATTLRLIATESYLILLGLLYLLTKQFTQHRIIALCAAWFLAATPDLYFWAQYIHPDLLQTLLVTMSVWIACRQHRFRSALLASVVAGLVFGVKYSGIFVLPFLAVPSLLAFVHQKWARQERLTRRDYALLAGVWCGMVMLFAAAWLISNPTVLTQSQEALKDILFEQRHVATGNKWADPKNPLLWLPVLYTEFKAPGTLLILIGGVMLIIRLFGTPSARSSLLSEPINRTLLTLLLYVSAGMLHVLLLVNARSMRYTFHLLPCLVLLVFTGLHHFITTMIPSLRLKWAAYLGIVVCIVPMTMQSLQAMDWCSGKYQHQYLKASTWIEQHYPPDIPILADAYSYRSPKFRNYASYWGIDEEAVRYYQPALLMINKMMSGRWSWKKPGTKFADLQIVMGEDQTHGGPPRIYDFHLKLFAPSSPYRVVYEDTDIVVLQHKELDRPP